MKERLNEAARAFATIAEHLPADRRAGLAERIAGLIEQTITPARRAEPSRVEQLPIESDLSEHSVIASFLADHDYERKALVDATLACHAFLVKHEGQFTREAGMRRWLHEQKGSK